MLLSSSLTGLAPAAYGGLYVSIVTDQWQGAAAVLFILVTAIYVAVTFRGPLPRPLPDYLLGNNEVGLSAIGIMPISLCAATVFRCGPC